MNRITKTIFFNDIESLNKFYYEFEKVAIQICEKHNTSELWANAKIVKEEPTLELAINSLGTYVKGTNVETAVIEIINTFNKMVEG